MKQYRIEAYDTDGHSGRPRVHYANGINPAHAVDTFHHDNPDCIVRTVWEFVPPGYWTPGASATVRLEETDPNNHLEDPQ